MRVFGAAQGLSTAGDGDAAREVKELLQAGNGKRGRPVRLSVNLGTRKDEGETETGR